MTSLFLSDDEHRQIRTALEQSPAYATLYAHLVRRAERRAVTPGLADAGVATTWWHYLSEYLTDAAIACRLQPTATLKAWLRDAVLSLARRPIEDWVGPSYRDHATQPPVGHLETAHLTWSLGIALDLNADLFSETELAELTTALREKGLTLCQRWLDTHHHVSNWRCILLGGLAVAAAVLNDAEAIAQAAREYALCADFFQPDGSYGESLQYGNYALYALMMAREALARRDPCLDETLPLEPHGKKPVWDSYGFLYKKPLSGWSSHPLPRAANFNDCAAIYRASGDVLMHLAARAKTKLPKEAALARWLFDTLYLPSVENGMHDQASFGFVNDFGFLTLILWPQAAEALSPAQAGLELVHGFSAGDVYARDAWDGRTVLAARTGGDPLHTAAHHHGDINSFILVHNRERLLVDPGHSCYRNLIHDLESSSLTHNTCTFALDNPGGLGLQEDLFKVKTYQQHSDVRRWITDGRAGPPCDRGARRLLLAREGNVTAIASEAGALYGEPIERFTRFWVLCGPHVLFVVDRIASSAPVKASASWLLNNRDGLLDLQLFPDRLVASRGEAALKIFNLTGATLNGPFYAYAHDAYHPLPNQRGEGRPGSGMLIRWTEKQSATERTLVHAIALDGPGTIERWQLKAEAGYTAVLEAPGGAELWKLKVEEASLAVEESVTEKSHRITQNNETWNLIPS